jgi:hypothetical protein
MMKWAKYVASMCNFSLKTEVTTCEYLEVFIYLIIFRLTMLVTHVIIASNDWLIMDDEMETRCTARAVA